MTSLYANLVYNPSLENTDGVFEITDYYNGETAVGLVKIHEPIDKGNKQTALVEWRTLLGGDIKICEQQYSRVIDVISNILTESNLPTACWENSTNYANVQQRMEMSVVSYILDHHKDTLLVSSGAFKAMVDSWLATFPKTAQLPYEERDLDDVVNEVGLGGIDVYSLMNMVSHFHSASWTEKAELMTLVAYRYHQDIHPLAIALTPRVAMDLLSD